MVIKSAETLMMENLIPSVALWEAGGTVIVSLINNLCESQSIPHLLSAVLGAAQSTAN